MNSFTWFRMSLLGAMATLGCALPPSTVQDSGLPNEMAVAPGAGRPADAGARARCEVPTRATSNAPTTAVQWDVSRVDTQKFPRALCNDGSVPLVGVRRNAASSRWLLFFEGGGFCGSDSTCNLRASDQPQRMRAATAMEIDSKFGIFEVDPTPNPGFHNVNMLFVPYCSSDLWSGDSAAIDAGVGASSARRFHFRGRAIAEAAIDLALTQGLNLAQDVVLAGSSAGGVGVLYRADDVAAQLPSGARFVAVADVAFQIEYPAFDPARATPALAQLPEAAVLWKGSADSSCARADAGLSCYRPQVLMTQGHVRTPTLLVQSQFDNNQISALGVRRIVSAQEQAYVRAFAAQMRRELGEVEARHGVWADFSSFHPMIDRQTSTRAVIDAGTVTQDVAQWVDDPCATQRRVEPEQPGFEE